MRKPTSATPFNGPAWAVGGISLLWGAVLSLHLTPALFAALITFGATRAFADSLQRRWPALRHAQSFALVLLLAIATATTSVVAERVAEAAARGSGYAGLLQQMASVLEQLRTHLPPWLAGHVPVSVDAARSAAATWLRDHAGQVQLWGGHTVRGIGYAIAGVIIGGLLAVQLPVQVQKVGTELPLALALRRGFEGLMERFAAVVFAQFRIAAINTALTGVYLLGILPLMGTPIPFASTLLAVTFVASLLPVVGNLLSNTMIVVVSLSQSVAVAGLSLLWLTGNHKLEYFLNAHIIGSRIRAKAWELLIAMLTMEAAFGLAGLISAPVLYAQIKHVLHQRDLL